MLTVADIREYTKDLPEFNVLLDGQRQSTDTLIKLAMRLAVDDFNSTTPGFSFTLEAFPSDSVLLYGALFHLANGEAERQIRNQLTYNAQGINAGIDDKMPQYIQLSEHYRSLFDRKAQALKVYLNQEAAWGGSLSPYALLNQYQYRS